MSKPAELIITNCMHEIATHLERMTKEKRASYNDNAIAAELLGMITWRMASEGMPETLYKMFAAVGGPGSQSELIGQLNAVLERRKPEHVKKTEEATCP